MKVFIFLCVILAVAVAYPQEVRWNSKRPIRPACPSPQSKVADPTAPPRNVTESGTAEPPAQSDTLPSGPSGLSTDETQNERGPVPDQPEQGEPPSNQDLVQESSTKSGQNSEGDYGEGDYGEGDYGESEASSDLDESDESDESYYYNDENDSSSEDE